MPASSMARTLPPSCAFPLQFAVEFAFGLAQLSRQALEGFFLVDGGIGADLGLEAGDAVGDLLGRGALSRSLRQRERLDQQRDFATNAITAGQLAAGIGHGAA